MSRNPSRWTVLVSALAALPLAAQVPIVATSPVGSAALTLLETAEGFLLEDGDGARVELEVPPGGRLTSVVELADGWIAAGQRLVPDGGELVLLGPGEEEPRAPRALAEPPDRYGFRQGPVPLAADGRLAGIAWLEGDGGEHNAVHAAVWKDEGWGEVETVSPWAGEAQVALRGAVLGDGSFLLVWSAVDGNDEDLYWSRFGGAGWSGPARVHEDNLVPDILPALAAVPGGALVAWSRDDGKDYRLRITRYESGVWRQTDFVGGEGSLRPTAYPAGPGAAAGFLYSTVTPRTWNLVELTAGGAVVRRAEIERTSTVPPRVVLSDASGVTLRLAGEGAGLGPAAATGSSPLDGGERRLPWALPE